MTAVVIVAWGIMVGVAELRARAKSMTEGETEAAGGDS